MEARTTKFSLGPVFITPGALAVFERLNESSFIYIQRHESGDWGEVCKEDREENEFAIEAGFRLLSAYRLSDGTKNLDDY